MSCTDPNPQLPEANRSESRAACDADEQEELEAQEAWDEVARHAGSLAHDAYYAAREPASGVILVPARDHELSPRATALAHGIWWARVKTHLYRATHTFVCLDCGWVGAFNGDGVDQEAESRQHECAGALA